MSYTKQTWANGDIITAAKLNHMEDGIAGVEADVSSLDTKLLASMPHDTASGSIASFPDGAAMPVIDCSVAVAPNQDLHGYDNPWPAGGGKNLLPTITSVTTLNGVTWTPNADGTIKVNGTASANSVIDFGRNVLTLPAGTYTTNQSVANQFDVNVFRLVNGSGVLHAQGGGTFTLTEESSIFVRFAVLTGVTVNNVIIQPMLESGSEMTSFAPYSNICPISGWTECKVTRTKNNLCSSGIGRWLWSNGVRYANTSGAYCGTNDKMPIKGGETYFLSFTNTESTNAIYINWFNGETFLETTAVWNANSWTGTAPENANYVAITFSNASAYTGDPTVSNVMLNIGSTATAYEAYQGQTYTIDLDGTRYGGTLDVTTGKLMVDRAMVDMGTLNWSSWEQGGSLIFNSHISAKMPVRDVPCISSQYAYNPAIVSSWSDLLNGQMTGQAGGDVVYVRDTRYSSNADFKTGVSGVQLVYPLATPIEVDLDPVTIETLLGTNNIFADCGDTTVDYYADTTLFVNKKIAAAVAALS